MDHIPQLLYAARSLPEVPLYRDVRLCFVWPNHQRFQEYHNLGWGIHPTALFQECLFFGTLKNILAVYDLPFDRADFIKQHDDGKEVITTRLLTAHLAAWVVQAGRQSKWVMQRPMKNSVNVFSWAGEFGNLAMMALASGTEQGVPSFKAAEKILHIVREAVDSLITIQKEGHEIDPSAWDSVLILLDTLLHSFFYIYRYFFRNFRDLEAEYRSLTHVVRGGVPLLVLPDLFKSNSWCSREIRIIRDITEGSLCTMALCAQMDRRIGELSTLHEECDRTICKAYQIDNEKYEPLHAFVGCQCKMIELDAAHEVEATEKIGLFKEVNVCVPMITWIDGEIRVQRMDLNAAQGRVLIQKVVSFDSEFWTRCVAISHVWADGMGNARTNGLYECQLSRIQTSVNNLFPAKYWPIPFWIDTLCIPVANQALRKTAIAQMEWVYKQSSKVLVLDRSLLRVRSEGMTEEEIGARIFCSGWARRLWTVQESAMQDQVYYQFADTTHVYKNLNFAIQQKMTVASQLALLPDGHPLRPTLDNPQGIRVSTSVLQQNLYKALSPSWMRISLFFQELDLDYGRLYFIDGSGRASRLGTMLRVLQSRTTSKVEDETLVLATSLERSPGAAAEILKLPVADRYRAIWTKFSQLPEHLIFLNTSRYQEDGYRYMPTTLLSQNSPAMDPIPELQVTYGHEGKFFKDLGLRVYLTAFLIKFPSDAKVVPKQTHVSRCTATLVEPGTGKYLNNISTTKDLAVIVPDKVKYVDTPDFKGFIDSYTGALVSLSNRREILAKGAAVSRYGVWSSTILAARFEALLVFKPTLDHDDSEVVAAETEPINPSRDLKDFVCMYVG